jgi:predicted RecA/RadA family phage recombinase
MKNFIQDGQHLDYASTAAVVSGQAILIGTKIGVAMKDYAANELGIYRVTGVIELPKKAADAPAVGAALYWDNTNKYLTVTASGNTYAGWAFAAAAGAAATVVTKINN